MKTAFVTGATGFIGGRLVDRLLGDDWRVVALCRPGSPAALLTDAGAEIADGDITDAGSVRAALPGGAELGYRHRPLAQSVRDTVGWLREAGEIRAGDRATAR